MKALFSQIQQDNILTTILSLLHVKYTRQYTIKYYNEHPHKYDMYGISTMLDHFGVKNMGIQIINKEKNISDLDPPFIAHIGNDFVVIENITKENITYYWNRIKTTIPRNKFLNIWSGATLIPEPDSGSIEPDYKKNRNNELIIKTQKSLLLLLGIIVLSLGIIHYHIYKNLESILFLICNIFGVYICYLIVLRQINPQSRQTDKICSLFAQSNCNDILKSPAARFMGLFSWSEIGLSYFLANTFIIIFISGSLSYLALINIFALPYSFWSIWYQKFKAKTWCPLCLIVQILFWILLVISLTFKSIHNLDFNLTNILIIGLCYNIIFLAITLLIPYITNAQIQIEIAQNLNSLKANDKVFISLLKQEKYYNVDKNTSSIILGNPNSKNLITIFTNPHCGPCAQMHLKIERLLKETNNNICIQYILSSFNEELISSNEFFIFINKEFTIKERNRIYHNWFEKGKYKKESLFKKYNFIPENTISEEYRIHLEWKEKNKLQATPTVLFNGYELPKIFFQDIENLLYFIDIDIESN